MNAGAVQFAQSEFDAMMAGMRDLIADIERDIASGIEASAKIELLDICIERTKAMDVHTGYLSQPVPLEWFL